MPLTNAFINNHTDFTSRYSILITEPLGLTHGLATNQNHNLAANILNFRLEPFGTMPSTAICHITNAAVNGSRPCYFLPYLPNGATTMTIGAGANYFFTSMMTGCSVQVHGPAATPTITHSNAAATFNNPVHGNIAAATAAAQLRINNQMPAVPHGMNSSMATRLDMEQDYNNNAGNMANNYQVRQGYRIKELAANQLTSHGTNRPELGMIVYGVRNAAGQWEFFRSSNVGVHGRQKKGHTFKGIKFGVKNRHIADSVSLGPAVRFWP